MKITDNPSVIGYEKMIINLNADIGESYGAYKHGNDEKLINHINSANIACGFHAGDPKIMLETVKIAKANNVSIGAHPSFPDLQGFGRRDMKLHKSDIYAMIIYQIGALQAIASSEAAILTHVKPHGALNNMAANDYDLAIIIAKAVRALDDKLIFLAPALSELVKAGEKEGLKVAHEIFADRTYEDDATLTPRSIDGAVIHDGHICAKRILGMLDKGAIISRNGKKLKTKIDSICVHGDTKNSVKIAKKLSVKLTKEGYKMAGLPEVIG